jgi:hypothetical protein
MGERRVKYRDKLGNLSGANYVRAELEGEPVRLPIKLDPSRCRHGYGTICHAAECIDSWQIDYTIIFETTAGGRALLVRANKDGTEHDKRKNKNHLAHPINQAT